MTHVPDFPAPSRAKGDHMSPDIAPRGAPGPSRGKYPADSGGPPQTRVEGGGPSGDPLGVSLTTFNETHSAPAKSPKFVASRDI